MKALVSKRAKYISTMAKRFLTLEEAVEYAADISNESDLSHIDFCQLPPDESGNITEEEDVNENILEPVIPGDVCGNIDVMIAKGTATVQDEIQQLESPSKSKDFGKNIRKKQKLDYSSNRTAAEETTTPTWRKKTEFNKNLTGGNLEQLKERHPELADLSPIDLFWKIFPKDYIHHLANMTRLYALQKGERIEVETEDIAQFFGLLLLSGYHSVPSEDLYWSTAEDTSVPIVPTVMPRNQFRKLKKYFHINDNSQLQADDKLGKIAPIYEELAKNFCQFGVFHKNLSIDESMVPYYGHHSAKMFIRGKPIRFGFKIWMLCSSTGYPYAMQIYCGKKEGSPKVPLGKRVVSELLSVVDEPTKHEVFFDNFFTSYDLMVQLSAKGFKAIGTIREQRTGKCPLKSTKDLAKCKRGDFDYRCDGSVFVCRWNDSAVVTVASNYCTHQPLGTAKRFSKAKKSKIDVPQPCLIQKYNEGMGGVDLIDRLLSSYRPQLRSKKWWWNLFNNALNMSVVAGWILHCEVSDNALSHLDFRREVTMGLLRQKERISTRPGPRSHAPRGTRTSDNHYLVASPQGRCVICQKNTRNKCFECDKRLHQHCFPQYHGK